MIRRGEFGLGAFAVGIMLLTHGNRLRCSDDLWIDCAGDECHRPRYSLVPFDHAPCFRFGDDGLSFGAGWSAYPTDCFGSVSGWVVSQS